MLVFSGSKTMKICQLLTLLCQQQKRCHCWDTVYRKNILIAVYIGDHFRIRMTVSCQMLIVDLVQGSCSKQVQWKKSVNLRGKSNVLHAILNEKQWHSKQQDPQLLLGTPPHATKSIFFITWKCPKPSMIQSHIVYIQCACAIITFITSWPWNYYSWSSKVKGQCKFQTSGAKFILILLSNHLAPFRRCRWFSHSWPWCYSRLAFTWPANNPSKVIKWQRSSVLRKTGIDFRLEL